MEKVNVKEIHNKGKGKNDNKGRGKGPKGGCFTCGGNHYASDCPSHGSAKLLDPQGQSHAGPQVIKAPLGAPGAYHPQPQPINYMSPPATHPALAQCNTNMPNPGENWMGVLELGSTVLEIPKRIHKASKHYHDNIKPTNIKNMSDGVDITDIRIPIFLRYESKERNKYRRKWQMEENQAK